MGKIKEFVENHKKAIIIGGVVVGTAIGAVIAYKLHLNKTKLIEDVAEAGENVAEAVIDTPVI